MDYALLENVILGVKILAAVITGLFLASLFCLIVENLENSCASLC